MIWLLEMPWEKGKIAGAYGAIPKSQQAKIQQTKIQQPTTANQQPNVKI